MYSTNNRTTSYRLETKGQWARDDPAFLLLLSIVITIASFAFAFAFFADTPFVLITVVFWTILVDLIGTGVIAATLGWFVANRWLRIGPGVGKMEWAYCFDIHLNAWLCLFLYVYMVVYVLLPFLIVPSSWVATLMANTIYACGIAHYFYVMFLGYASVPSLKGTNIFLWPVVAIVILLVLLTVGAKFNVVIFVMNLRYAS